MERPNMLLSIKEYVQRGFLETNLRRQQQAELEAQKQEIAAHEAFLRDEQEAYLDTSLKKQAAYESKLQRSQADKHRRPLREWQKEADYNATREKTEKAELVASLSRQDEIEIREIYLKKQDGPGRNPRTTRTREITQMVR